MLTTLLKVLGLGNGTGLVSTAVGIANWAAFLPVAVYLYSHSQVQINFNISLGFLALIAGFMIVLIELARRN